MLPNLSLLRFRPNYSLALSFCFIFLVSSCGTFKRHGKIVALDSEPRGQNVRDRDGLLLGKTPLWYKGSRSRYSHVFQLEVAPNQFKRKRVFCKIDWKQSVVPAAVPSLLFPVGTILGGLSLSVDLVSGGLFNCDTLYRFEVDTQKELEKSPYQRRWIILPPATVDINWWRGQYREMEKIITAKYPNDEVIPMAEVFKLVSKWAFHKRKVFANDIPWGAIRVLAAELGANHLYLYIEENRDDNYWEGVNKAYDLFTRKVDPFLTTKIKMKTPFVGRPWWKKWGLLALRIIPNAVRFQTPLAKTTNFNNDTGTIFDRTPTNAHPMAWPKMVQMIGVDSLYHPDHYDIWDYAVGTFPTFGASSWRQVLGEKESINLINYYTIYNVGITGHTPMGAFTFELGHGKTLIDYDGSLVNDDHRWETITRSNLNYVGFINRHWFVKVDLTSFSFGEESPVNLPSYQLKGWQEGSIGVGYYFDNIEHLAIDLFPK